MGSSSSVSSALKASSYSSSHCWHHGFCSGHAGSVKIRESKKTELTYRSEKGDISVYVCSKGVGVQKHRDGILVGGDEGEC